MELGLVVRVLLVDCEAVPTEAHNTTLSPASRARARSRPQCPRGPHACARPVSFFRTPRLAIYDRSPCLAISESTWCRQNWCRQLPLRASLASVPSRAASAQRTFFAGSLARPANLQNSNFYVLGQYCASSPPRAGRRLRFRRMWMKTRLE